MKTIWKYPLEITDRQMLIVPEGGRFLTVQLQKGELTLWAEVDTEACKRVRQIAIIGTGNSAEPAPAAVHRYIGTAQMLPFVWHVFEVEYEGEQTANAESRHH